MTQIVVSFRLAAKASLAKPYDRGLDLERIEGTQRGRDLLAADDIESKHVAIAATENIKSEIVADFERLRKRHHRAGKRAQGIAATERRSVVSPADCA